MMSKMLVPETEQGRDLGDGQLGGKSTDANLLDAAASRSTHDSSSPGAQYRRDIDLIPQPGRPGEYGFVMHVGTSLQEIVGWAIAPVAYLLECTVGKLCRTSASC